MDTYMGSSHLRHHRTRFSAGILNRMLIGCVALLLLAGCSPEQGVPTQEPLLTAKATLDWDNALIALPLNAYGMSPAEEAVVDAARNVLISQCASPDGALPAAEVQRSQVMLTSPRPGGQWLYGYWNAAWISVHGWVPVDTMYLEPARTLGGGTAQSRIENCAQEESIQALSVIAPNTLVTGFDSAASLVRFHLAAYDQTMADSRFLNASTMMASCIQDAGYSLDPSAAIPITFADPSWSDEQNLAAALAEAECADSLSFTQQVGDINASYQQVLIDDNEAELVAIRAEVDKRLLTAHAVLREAGLE